uniref:ankyrin repeat domain-containing protein SOWAHC n=1 Tax=Euleptes europaea TaxID=460621 RepID=UPI002540EACE|nr:ankyrin repeat domain-containing protein SOWAHC [Euleptes europaea]
MAAPPPELHQDAVLRFLAESRGGRARNADLLDHFRAFLDSPDAERRAAARARFKEMVNAVAVVKQEPGSGAKYVQLRKKYRGGGGGGRPADDAAEPASEAERGRGGGGDEASEERPSPSPLSAEAGARPRGGGREAAGAEEVEEAPPEVEEAPAAPPPAPPRGGRGSFPRGSPRAKRVGGGWAPRRERDSDSASLASSSAEEESGSTASSSSGGASVALDPLEHAWMLCASDGRWESLEALLGCEPALLGRRDFVTGFSCLHWAAKQGRHELLALLVAFARRHRLPVDVNARTSGGYTCLHLAAMHGHLEVVKLLVGAYDADVDVRDYSGRKAAHYLGPGAAEGLRGLVGGLHDEEGGGGAGAANGGGRWRLSKVLPSNLITYKLSHLHHGEEGEPGEGPGGGQGKGKELHRKGSGGGSGRAKPRLNKIRFRTQIIHTTPSFRGEPEEEEEEGQEEKPLKTSSFKLRPKSNVFG